MSEPLPFCKIKLQSLLEMVTDHELDDNALRVALYLTLAHSDHETGESRPSFEKIGAAIGKHAKSVKRALNKVEAAGYMTVERGTNKGKSSRYRPTEAALKRATDRRGEGDKVVPLSRAKGGQSCPQSGTDLSGKGGQDRPPNREQELRKERGRASAPDLPDEGQTGGTRPDLVFVPRGICFVRDWDARLAREGMTTLERSLPLSPHEHHLGFWLPARTPAPVDSAEWQILKLLVNEGEHVFDGRIRKPQKEFVFQRIRVINNIDHFGLRSIRSPWLEPHIFLACDVV